jgi:hypothetical protein
MKVPPSSVALTSSLPLFFNGRLTIVIQSAVRTESVTDRAVICLAVPAGDYLKHVNHRQKRTSTVDDMCRRAQTHAVSIGRNCRPEIASLMVTVTKRLVEQPQPANELEYEIRSTQAHVVSGVMRALSHANSTMKHVGSNEPILLAECEKLAAIDLPRSREAATHWTSREFEFNALVRNLCQS